MWCRQIVSVLNRAGLARGASCAAGLDFQDIPSPRGLPVIGTALSLIAAGGPSRLHEYIDRRHQQLGSIFKDNVGPVTAVFVSDPEVMRSVFAQEGKHPIHIKPEPWVVYNEKHNYTRGLFFMDGEKWLYFRRIMNKLLLKGDLAWIENCCTVASELLINRIQYYSEKNVEFPNLEKELYKWSMDVIVSVLMGADTYRKHHNDVEPLVQKLATTVHLVFESTSKLSLLPATLAAKYNIPQWRRFEGSVTATLKSANEIVDSLMEKYPNGNGLLDRLRREEVGMVDIQRIVADFMIAGGDTTTYTMEWMLYEISKNQSLQEKLRNSDKTLSRNIIRETLRLYPVAPFLTRIMPDVVNIAGYSIPPGTLVVMSIYTSGREEKYFKNATEFLPDRWSRDSKHDMVNIQQASLPFAIGARSCIGRKISESQLQVMLAKIVEKYDVESLNVKNVDLIMKMVAKPAESIRLKFNRI